MRLRSGPLPGPAPAANTIACAEPMCGAGRRSRGRTARARRRSPRGRRRGRGCGSGRGRGRRARRAARAGGGRSGRDRRATRTSIGAATRGPREGRPDDRLELLAAFVLIIGGAIGFTNAVEWLGKRMNLAEGAVGALLAAVGTALPESVIPIVALIGGGGQEADRGRRSAPSSARRSCSARSRCCSWSAPPTLFAGRREQGTDGRGPSPRRPPRPRAGSWR